MVDTRYVVLADVISDELFPDVDLALRRGRHIDREDAAWYPFLVDAQALLEEFYRRFGCELTHPADGYFYLLPTNDKLGRRHLSVPEMLVGQALTLLYLDPATLEHGGVQKRADALSHLSAVMGSDALTRAFNPKRKRLDPRVAEETVRSKFSEALRRLSSLGFVDLLPDDSLRLRPALLRFAEPVRGRGSPAEALERLLARGELVLGDSGLEDSGSDGLDEDSEPNEGSEPNEDEDHEDEDNGGAEQVPPVTPPELTPAAFADFADFSDYGDGPSLPGAPKLPPGSEG